MKNQHCSVHYENIARCRRYNYMFFLSLINLRLCVATDLLFKSEFVEKLFKNIYAYFIIYIFVGNIVDKNFNISGRLFILLYTLHKFRIY